MITDYQWFNDLGYASVFTQKMTSQLKIAVPVFILFFLISYYYLRSLKKNYYDKIQSYHISVSEGLLNKIIVLPSILMGLIASSLISSRWLDILVYQNANSFDIVDPIFNKDISFYLFKLPLLKEMMAIFMVLLFLMVILTVVFYFLIITFRRPTLYEVDGKFKWRNNLLRDLLQVALKQLVIVSAVFFIILAIDFYLGAYDIMFAQGAERGVIFGPGYTEVLVNLKLYRVQLVISLLTALGILWAYRKKQLKLAIIGPLSLILITIIGNIVAGAVDNFVVTPNQRAKQLPFIENNIAYTRMAYDLDKIQVQEFQVKDGLTIQDIQNNKETINNIRLNDYRPTIESFNQLQAIRFYYQFLDVDIDRYLINDSYTQVFLGPRELNIELFDDNARNWINQHLKYTHGYGVALSPVNAVTSQGQPQLSIRNIPPVSDIDIQIERPEIYFGELTNHYIVVNTQEKEFDYPVGNDNAETMYEGSAGIPLNFLNRLLYSYREGTMKLLLSGSITSESRIITHRNIHERANLIAPFIQYDEDPYIVINEGRLYWIIDGYTASNRFPNATPFGEDGVNYMRNSVKVVIDAYHGDVKYYIADETDPIIKTYEKIFPELFQPLDHMDEGLRAHIRYPQDLFDLQSQVYGIYHMTNPNVFYNQEDVWHLAYEKYYELEQPAESQYMVMKLPNEEREEFVLTVNYTPRNLSNLTAILAARNDGAHYGEIIAYQLPKDRNISGPMQIEGKIDSEPNIASSLSLWGEGGSEVIRGNMLVIPIEESLLYVEPLYIQSTNQISIPSVKQVFVAYEDQVVMADTLELALQKIFGEAAPPDQEDQSKIPGIDFEEDIETIKILIEKANEAYDKAQEALQRGDWTTYGSHLSELEDILKKLKQESY